MRTEKHIACIANSLQIAKCFFPGPQRAAVQEKDPNRGVGNVDNVDSNQARYYKIMSAFVSCLHLHLRCDFSHSCFSLAGLVLKRRNYIEKITANKQTNK